MSSDAVGLERVSRIIGYKITKGNFSNTTPNLPQRIAILAEANSANQLSFTDGAPQEITSAQQAGQLYGYGSPIHHIMRILRPNSGTGIGGIPTVVYPQEEASEGAAAKVLTLVPEGTATANGTHTLVIAGRTGLDGVFYDINIQVGDDAEAISSKIVTAVSAVLGCPLTATLGGGEDADEVILTSKWKGLTANDISVSVNTNDKDLGITYGITSTAAGSGTPGIEAALSSFGNEWNTIVINSYGTVSSIIEALEDFNGVPDPENPTGRYSGIIMKPFIALTGFTGEDPSLVTDVADRKDQVTIAICPAPLSKGLAMEAAANMAVLFGRQTQDTPHLDVAARSYPDMPTPAGIGSMARYEERDVLVKKGCSTVDLVNGRYAVQDFVTTYHPEGENPPQFRYCRNLMLDFNIRFSYFLKEQTYVVDHAIAANDDIVSASKVVKPKQWKQVLDQMADDLARRSLIVDAGFMKDSIEVNISSTNPDRLETFFKYKRSGFARISSTTVEAGFNFGNV